MPLRRRSVEILHVAKVVSDAAAEDVRQSPAGFLKYHLRCTCAPEFCPVRQVHVQIAVPFGDHPDLYTDRSAADLAAKPELFYDTRHFRAAVIAGRNGDSPSRENRFLPTPEAVSGSLPPFFLEIAPLPFDGYKEYSRGKKHDACDRLAVFRKPDLNGKIAVLFNKTWPCRRSGL